MINCVIFLYIWSNLQDKSFDEWHAEVFDHDIIWFITSTFSLG